MFEGTTNPRKQAFEETESQKRSLCGEIHPNLLLLCSWRLLLIPKMWLRIQGTKEKVGAKQLSSWTEFQHSQPTQGEQIGRDSAPGLDLHQERLWQTNQGVFGTPKGLYPICQYEPKIQTSTQNLRSSFKRTQSLISDCDEMNNPHPNCLSKTKANAH